MKCSAIRRQLARKAVNDLHCQEPHGQRRPPKTPGGWYIHEAIDVERAGRKVKLRKTADLEMPEEFQTKLDESPALKKAFDGLTPGRQRAYLLYFSQAKQAKTRESRIAKCKGPILKGKGLHD